MNNNETGNNYFYFCEAKNIMEWFLFFIGGSVGLYQAVSKLPVDASDSHVSKTGSVAFIMGVIIYGGILNLIYMIF